ncbi:hypothetical protein D9615_002042 [Tricholomella constricta]|uniref:Kinase n=1 Tax=Tricholomella constricta TaxID=117010 RepID=A0A8H5MAN1_9AGAR|nr:hypothetical protein D9615_002042 [Tricholomella constricta]
MIRHTHCDHRLSIIRSAPETFCPASRKVDSSPSFENLNMQKKPSPSSPTIGTGTAQPRPFKVIGHAGMRTTGDGSLIIKPAFPAERQFYETLVQDPYLAPLRPFIPRFFGTLQPETQGKGGGPRGGIPIPPGRTQSLILENLCNTFVKPNTLDVKLGTLFYDEFTAPDKVLRNERTACETTSRATGVRLTEFQVYDNTTSQPVCTPKSYGKAMKASDLPAGIAQFFPVSRGSSKLGLPRKTLVPILRGIRDIVSRIHEVYMSFEMRIIGGSLLIMYEADWSRAEDGVKRSGLRQPAREDDHDVNNRQPFVVKLVDFAHTRLTPGEGPDEGVLLGLDTMVKLLDGRIAQLA